MLISSTILFVSQVQQTALAKEEKNCSIKYKESNELNAKSERFESGEYFHSHYFNGKAGTTVRIDMLSNDFDSFFNILGPNGLIIGSGYDSYQSTNASFTLTLPTNGIYQIRATSNYPGEKGRYLLSCRPATNADIKQAISFGNAIERANTLSQKAFQLDQSRNRAEALPIAQKSIEIYREQLGVRHPFIAKKLINLALLYKNLQRFRDAESIYKEALSIHRSHLGDGHPEVALALNSLAVVYEYIGRYSDAEPLYQQALEINKKVLNNNSPRIATALNNLAGLYYFQGRYGEMKPLLEEALSISKKISEPVERGKAVASSLGWLAFMYRAQGQSNKAKVLHQQVLKLDREYYGDRHNVVAIDLNNLGEIYLEEGRYAEAKANFNEALDIYREVLELGTKHYNYATSLKSIGILYYSQGDYREALSVFEESLSIFKEQFPDNNPETAVLYTNLSKIFFLEKQALQAFEYLNQAVMIQEENLTRNLIAGSEQQKRDYISTISNTFNISISLDLNLEVNDLSISRLALLTVIQRKGRILDYSVNALNQLYKQTNDLEIKRLLSKLENVRFQYSNLLFRKYSDSESQKFRKSQLAKLDTQAKTIENLLSRRSSDFSELTSSHTLEDILRSLPAKTSLVEFIRYQPFISEAKVNNVFASDHYAAYVLQANGHIQSFDLGPAEEIDNAVKTLSISLSSLDTPIFQVKEDARNVDELIMAPVRKVLGKTNTIYLSPDGILNLIPFEALMDEYGNYLVNRYQFRYLTSGRDLVRLAKDSHNPSSSVLFGDPTFSRDVNLLKKPSQVSSKTVDFMNNIFPRLSGTAVEIKQLAQRLPNSQVYLSSSATEDRLKSVKQPRILHIATHGYFKESNNNVNPLLNSGLVLAGVKERQSGPNQDGILSALEVTGLNLRGTELVVLSACDTGRGKLTFGEGVYGLRRALVLAGSRSQVISLWKVDDNATQEFMVDYYDRLLAGENRDAALREIQRAFLKHPDFNHPYYWSAFISSGDWRPLFEKTEKVE